MVVAGLTCVLATVALGATRGDPGADRLVGTKGRASSPTWRRSRPFLATSAAARAKEHELVKREMSGLLGRLG